MSYIHIIKDTIEVVTPEFCIDEICSAGIAVSETITGTTFDIDTSLKTTYIGLTKYSYISEQPKSPPGPIKIRPDIIIAYTIIAGTIIHRIYEVAKKHGICFTILWLIVYTAILAMLICIKDLIIAHY